MVQDMKDSDRYLYAAFVIIILIMFFSYFVKTTGFAPMNEIIVSIRENFEGKITLLTYYPTITIYDYQNITTEFTDTGSLPMEIRMETYVYIYNNGTLNLSGQYIDTTAYLNPGMRRTFRAMYTPPDIGTYYIKVKVIYESRVAETWGIFNVITHTATRQAKAMALAEAQAMAPLMALMALAAQVAAQEAQAAALAALAEAPVVQAAEELEARVVLVELVPEQALAQVPELA
jgi:hypothetical protein